jgi:hypothetical protein
MPLAVNKPIRLVLPENESFRSSVKYHLLFVAESRTPGSDGKRKVSFFVKTVSIVVRGTPNAWFYAETKVFACAYS